MEWVGEPDKKEKYISAENAIAEYYRFFDQHRIYISPDLCTQLENFAKNLRSPIIQFGVWVKHQHLTDIAAQKKNEAWDAAWASIKNDVPQIRAAIEKEFRVLLGSNDKTS